VSGNKDIAFVDFSLDGKRLVTAGRWNAQVWDAATGSRLVELGELRNDDPSDKAFSMGVRFSPDGRRIASVLNDLLRIWSIPEAALRPDPARSNAQAVVSPLGARTEHSSDPSKTTSSQEFLTTRTGAIKLKKLPAGLFLMGSPKRYPEGRADESPQHKVQISRPFYLGVYEVTQAQYCEVTGRNPSWFSALGGGRDLVAGQSTDGFPVENMSWVDAVKFCNILSNKEGVKPFYVVNDAVVSVPDWRATGFRLPTEAEWEFACRAGTLTRWSFGDDYAANNVRDYVWLTSTSGRDELLNPPDLMAAFKGDWQKFMKELARLGCRTHPVGEKRPNAFGLFDMHGNIREWCWDWFDKDYYEHGPKVDPTGGDAGPTRIYRGGYWASNTWDTRSAVRGNEPGMSDAPNLEVGFRLARSSP
jgi:formylglycine-generating enzyme required for sulfatase activity